LRAQRPKPLTASACQNHGICVLHQKKSFAEVFRFFPESVY
jgi:hypothetical protein